MFTKIIPLLLALAAGLAAESDDLRARLSLVRQLARETNDPALVDRVTAFSRTAAQMDPAQAEAGLRELEGRVGIDPGGWSMNGLPIFHARPDDGPRLAELNTRLRTAMDAGGSASIAAVVGDMRALLGDRAGLPDMRRLGRRPQPGDITPAAAYEALRAELSKNSPLRRSLRDGTPAAGTMLRVYAGLLQTLTLARQAAQRLHPDDLGEIDRLADGAAAILLGLQRPDGHFPFPDLRGRNIRFGAMIEQELGGGAQVEDGWVLSVLANGGTYFDTGLAGQALIAAGTARSRPEWIAAGVRAAGFCAKGPLSTNWNYNAFAAGLCADASRLPAADPALREAALRFALLGVIPGQLAEGPRAGRWIDPHNARDVYHLILLRGLHDVAAALPADHPDRAAVASAARRAVASLCAEQAAGGVAVIALRELERHAGLVSDPDPRLPTVIAEQRALAAALPERLAGNPIDLAWLAASAR